VSTQISLPVGAIEPAGTTLPSRRRIHSLSELLIYGSATLGVAVGVERLFGFLSGVLAARIAGPQNFGAYSMVLVTAGAIAAYAGAGIGTTATRFSGQYRPGSQGYRKFILTLAIISLGSATCAAVLMLVGAAPLARWLIRNEGLISFLRIAAASSAAIVLLECCRGLLVGQQRFHALMILSVVSGLSLILVLPLAAKVSVGMMIVVQAGVALTCVGLCVALSKPFGLRPIHEKDMEAGPGIRPVLTFGLVQFGAFAGISIASWWIASLVARSDVTLMQMGLYAIANQFRGLAVLAPGLFAQVGYSLLTDESAQKYGGAGRVMLMNSFLAASLATMAAGFGIVVAPWLLTIVYGKSFSGAEVPVLILLATGIVHMAGIPAAQRLSIIGLRVIGVINTVWAIVTAGVGMWLVPKAGATGAALTFLISHTVSQVMVIVALARIRELPGGYPALFIVTTIGSFLLVGLGYWRAVEADPNPMTLGLAGLALAMLLAVLLVGRRIGCLPKWKSIRLRFSHNEQSDLAHS
jgi:O-antigen/teichoic acid export membrane protein